MTWTLVTPMCHCEAKNNSHAVVPLCQKHITMTKVFTCSRLLPLVTHWCSKHSEKMCVGVSMHETCFQIFQWGR